MMDIKPIGKDGYIVKFEEGALGEPIQFEMPPRTDEETEVLFEGQMNVIATFYWDSHGTLVPFPCDGKKSLSRANAKIKIEKLTYKQFDTDWEHWSLYINGEKLAGDVYKYWTNASGLNAKVIVGWG